MVKMKSAPTNMRGQMGLRSGPLAPTSAKLTTQYLVLDHMNNHYSKITKARPAIDNKPPRSMASSQKARDRKSRDTIEKTGKRPASGMNNMTRRPYTSTGYYQDDIYDENLWGEVDPEDEEEMLIHNIMRTTLRDNESGANDLGQGPSNYNQAAYQNTRQQRPSSARSLRSVGSAARTMVQVKKPGTYDGDIIEKRSHAFTEEKPFTPRTLKTDRKSRLSQYKYYNKIPPKDGKPKQQARDTQPEVTEKVSEETTEKRPQPKPRASKRLDRTREGPVTMNSLMFETLHSRDFSKNDGNNPDVPKLDISMDTDHLKWIKDQASKSKHRTNNETMRSTLHEEDPCDTTVDYGKTGEMSLTYGTLGSTKTRPPVGANQRSSPEDEEGRYVRFMKEVTNDIINRGIYTDRAVRQVFKSHIAKNKDRLDELRMRQITDDIRTQLNIPRYDIDDQNSYTSTMDASYKPHHGNDLHLDMNTSNRGQSLGETGTLTNGTLEASEKSKASRGSAEQSQDTYNFKSTEDDDLYSTIRSDMNITGTLTDTMALKSYQASIKEQDGEDLEEGEIAVREDRYETRAAPNVQAGIGVRGGQNVLDGVETRSQQNGQAETRSQSGRTSDRATNDGTDYQDDEEDEYDDEIYEDDGDDEDDDDDDIMETTEPTATYRTDDGDF